MSKQRLLAGIAALVALVAVGAIIYVTNQAPAKDELAARVNGVPISIKDYKRQLSTLEGSSSLQYSTEEKGQRTAELEKLTIDRMIDLELARQMALEAGIKVGDDEVDARYQALVQASGGSEALAQSIAKQGMSDAAFKEQIRTQLLIDRYTKKIAQDVSVSDSEVTGEYEQNQGNYVDSAGKVLPFEQVKEQIHGMLLKEKETDAFNKKLDAYKKKSDLEIFVGTDEKKDK